MGKIQAELRQGTVDGVPIITEPPTHTRRLIEVDPDQEVDSGINVLRRIAAAMRDQLKTVGEPTLITVMRRAIVEWDEDSVKELIKCASGVGRQIAGETVLLAQYRVPICRV